MCFCLSLFHMKLAFEPSLCLQTVLPWYHLTLQCFGTFKFFLSVAIVQLFDKYKHQTTCV
eukprot:m.115150 g.115150  ORF g.115150 m.115150 type:complete len:60 (-) comp16328_c0_seq5:46-225(-)